MDRLEKLQTRFDEIITRTLVPSEMVGLYLSTNLLRGWIEDFIDEDTGEVVSIERNETILPRGTLLNGENIARVQFHIDAGDINIVELSNQNRTGIVGSYYPSSMWVAHVELPKKTIKILLYASSINMATLIVEDFMEQKCPRWFIIKGISRMKDNYEVIYDPHVGGNSYKDSDCEYYKVSIVATVFVDDIPIDNNHSYILRTKDADTASIVISNHINKDIKQIEDHYIITIIEASIISCSKVIDREFSIKYNSEKDTSDEV